ncbi:MAG: hypothetical protein HOC25_04005 [Flavobacteriales bacterium]|nr:hypothetical protein [Flavobacteriales bacterium]
MKKACRQDCFDCCNAPTTASCQLRGRSLAKRGAKAFIKPGITRRRPASIDRQPAFATDFADIIEMRPPFSN